jgi:hypothetical protein
MILIRRPSLRKCGGRRISAGENRSRNLTAIASIAEVNQRELIVTANAGKTLSGSSEQKSETACKPKKASRTLRFNKWIGYAAASVSGLVSLGDAFGYMKADWTCTFLLIAVVAISSYNYWLRLHTTNPVK